MNNVFDQRQKRLWPLIGTVRLNCENKKMPQIVLELGQDVDDIVIFEV
jgi:hypothetical protein